MTEDVEALISVAPTDPEKKKEWATHMARIQYAMWVDDDSINFCCHCKKKYTSVDNWMSRHPKRGYDDDFFVDSECWDEYVKRHEDG